MITDPVRQRDLRGNAPALSSRRATGQRARNTAEHQAELAPRLTPRDHWILAMVHEHRVLTASQITDMAFPSFRSGRQRLRELYLWGVLDRFQPYQAVGSSPMHYVLGPAGAAVLAAVHGIDPRELGYRHDRAFGIAHNLRLAHTVGVNEWFAALVTAAHHPDRNDGHMSTVDAWWSEARCARHFGDLVRPDAYGCWNTPDRRIEFFLEFDLGTEALTRVAAKLAGYAALAAATRITTPLLVWLPTTRREAGARVALHRAWRDLDQPDTVPIATAAAIRLAPQPAGSGGAPPSPADPVWLPLHYAGLVTGGPRMPLHRLSQVWPHVPDLPTQAALLADEIDADQEGPTRLPAPHPMPPAPSHATRAPATSG